MQSYTTVLVATVGQSLLAQLPAHAVVSLDRSLVSTDLSIGVFPQQLS